MVIEKTPFGMMPDGRAITLYTMTNSHGLKAAVTDYGAILVSLVVPDRDGNLVDVVLGRETGEGYFTNSPGFGSTIGRSGNRIAGGKLTIGGVEYQLACNEGPNNLHSGPNGYQYRLWEGMADEHANSVTFFLVSPDGDQGYPGEFQISVTYTLTELDGLRLTYHGVSDKDTIANLTNHSYFNLNGHDSGDALDHTLWLKCSHFTPVFDPNSIPTGELAPVAGTPMDFTTAKVVGDDIDADFEQLNFTGGFDHNFAIDREEGDGIVHMATMASEKTGITMEVYTDCVGVQFYAGNFVVDEPGKGGCVYQKRGGLCLETQFFPNAINTPSFASPLLRAGEEYHTVTEYRFV